jgi:hypothetical protein
MEGAGKPAGDGRVGAAGELWAQLSDRRLRGIPAGRRLLPAFPVPRCRPSVSPVDRWCVRGEGAGRRQSRGEGSCRCPAPRRVPQVQCRTNCPCRYPASPSDTVAADAGKRLLSRALSPAAAREAGGWWRRARPLREPGAPFHLVSLSGSPAVHENDGPLHAAPKPHVPVKPPAAAVVTRLPIMNTRTGDARPTPDCHPAHLRGAFRQVDNDNRPGAGTRRRLRQSGVWLRCPSCVVTHGNPSRHRPLWCGGRDGGGPGRRGSAGEHPSPRRQRDPVDPRGGLHDAPAGEVPLDRRGLRGGQGTSRGRAAAATRRRSRCRSLVRSPRSLPQFCKQCQTPSCCLGQTLRSSVTGRHSASRSTTSRQARCACCGW